MPYLELEASLFVTGTQITLATQGWAGNNLFFTLSSNPAKSREEIFALLNWSEQLQDPESLSLLKLIRGNIAAVTDGILGPFFDEFRELIQVDPFSLEQDRDFGGLRMSVGKALGRDVFLSYSRNLSTLAEEIWTLEGRLTSLTFRYWANIQHTRAGSGGSFTISGYNRRWESIPYLPENFCRQEGKVSCITNSLLEAKLSYRGG